MTDIATNTTPKAVKEIMRAMLAIPPVVHGNILIVDDAEFNRELLETLLTGWGYACELAASGAEALEKIGSEIDLVLMDVHMPEMDGLEATRRIRCDPAQGDLPIIIVTALSGKQERLRAVEAGANDFVEKPIDKTELQVRIASLLKLKVGQDQIKRNKIELERSVELRTEELRSALEMMADAQAREHEAHIDTIGRLAIAAEYRDENTANHIRRVGEYCAVIAQALQLPLYDVESLRKASPMHDVGKIGIPDGVLLKPGKFTLGERRQMEQHTLIGARILGGSSSELLQIGECIALTHHEKWDGSGYPRGLAGEAIPLYGRICAVADVFDALTSERPYKDAFSNENALAILREGRGTHFDPAILDVFLANFNAVLRIQREYADPNLTALAA